MGKQKTQQASRLYNRELSWLDFNDRVLQEAKDSSVPLLQRLRFLGIFSGNLDEFIKVRLANMIREVKQDPKQRKRAYGGMSASKLLDALNWRIAKLYAKFDQVCLQVKTQMENEGIYIVNHKSLTQEQYKFCKDYFISDLSARLSPIVIGEGAPTPFLEDGALYMATWIEGNEQSHYAIIDVPLSATCSRFITLPSSPDRIDIIFIDDVIRLFLDNIFFMFEYEKIEAYSFQIERDALLTLDDDLDRSLEDSVAEGVKERRGGRPMRLKYSEHMPLKMVSYIAKELGIKNDSQLEHRGKYLHLKDLMKFPKVNNKLEYPHLKPSIHPSIDPMGSLLSTISKGDILLCYPYHTFGHFVDLLREAAIDPHVKRISITIYRSADSSKVSQALVNAVRNGKKVRALVEIKARFDEEHNIATMNMLEAAGVQIINSTKELKIHTKLLLIEREEDGKRASYTYVGTGNFNEDTAAVYSDFGLLTKCEEVGSDARKIFKQLKNTTKQFDYQQLLVSPHHMRGQIEALVEGEIDNANNGKEARFDGKFNAITDEKMIELLYRASAAGVKIRLIVRGECSLMAGVEGLSENIEVHSIVDKYLEHSRVIIAHNNGNPLSYILSADLMKRNLEHRIEAGIQVTAPELAKQLGDFFEIQWRDNQKSRLITPPFDNNYLPSKDTGEPHRCQEELHALFGKAIQ